MRKASLFSGIGGIDLAAEWAGMKTVVFCEIDSYCQRVLQKHWPDVPIISDVRDFTWEELVRRGVIGNGRTIDILSAGFPCQPVSFAGKRRGAEDDRWLWPEVVRIVQYIRPTWVVLENVVGLINLGLDDVLSDLENLGYTAQAFVIPACAVYASHRRDRVFVVAYSGGGKRKSGAKVKGILRALPADGTINRDTGGRGSAQSREDVADTEGQRREERHASAGGEGIRRYPRGAVEAGIHGSRRPTQPGMGGSIDELSAALDRGLNPLDALHEFISSYPQPALIGMPQHDWEPPRVATGIKNRSARLRALGNAVDPLQIFPIMYAIRLIDDCLRMQRKE